jgi:hypothetical protein
MMSRIQFGAIFTKKPVLVDKLSENEPESEKNDFVTVAGHVDGTVYPIPTDEFKTSYELVPGSNNQYRSKSDLWKDIRLVLPGTVYHTLRGDVKRAVSGILVREQTNANTFYEISPYYAIGAFTPAADDPEARDTAIQILNRAHLQGPIEDLSAMNNYAFKLLFVNRPYVLSLAGYTTAPDDYAQIVQTSLTEIIDALGDGKVGFISSPTVTPNSIDAIATELAQKYTIPTIYVTAEEYLKYIEPSKFPPGVDRKLYEFTEKFFFKKPTDYSQATAWASNVCVVIGGRDTAVQDVVNGLKRGNKVIIIDAENLTQSAWDQDQNRVGNASKYLMEQMRSFKETGKLRYESIGGLTAEFMDELSAKGGLDRDIKILRVGKDVDKTTPALKRQLKHLDAFLDGPVSYQE